VGRSSRSVAALRDDTMRLYKYMSADSALRCFRTGMVRFTQPVEFNDPFEMQPFVKGLADEPSIEAQFREQFGATVDPELDKMLSTLTPEQRTKIDRNSIRDAVQQQAPEALALLKRLAEIATPLVSRQIYDTGNENLGALCLTEKPDNLLMWTHYADHHRGVVIEFDTTHDFFNRRLGPQDDFRHFRKVIYTQDRPNVFLADSDAVDFFYFKSKEWEYEQEWRLIVPLGDCSQRIEQPLGYPICLFNIPPECVHGVIIGCRMPEPQKFALAKLVRQNPEFNHLRFQQAETDKHVFAIRRRSVATDLIDRWISTVSPVE
jgi:hypothetical protein